jgi:hypothetical protein
MNLVQLIVSWEEWEETEYFEEYSSDSPYVHLVAIVAVS